MEETWVYEILHSAAKNGEVLSSTILEVCKWIYTKYGSCVEDGQMWEDFKIYWSSKCNREQCIHNVSLRVQDLKLFNMLPDKVKEFNGETL